MTDASDITFERGYRRLQEIAERLNGDEVPVHEMCDLFAEGKGLEQALTAYLDQQKERVEAIERGQGIQAFRVIAPAQPTTTAVSAELAGVGQNAPLPRPAGVPLADDDIPF